ncbi:hypothetical protein AMECASPLE_014014 [Ameca splendens]|uniref:Uncharacterized protein n=1 Tax=Ameca splendens TaxID=208324 RepID=A0ABV0XEM7_9TELE
MDKQMDGQTHKDGRTELPGSPLSLLNLLFFFTNLHFSLTKSTICMSIAASCCPFYRQFGCDCDLLNNLKIVREGFKLLVVCDVLPEEEFHVQAVNTAVTKTACSIFRYSSIISGHVGQPVTRTHTGVRQ